MHVERAAAVQRDGERAYGRTGCGAAPGGAICALGLGGSRIVCEAYSTSRQVEAQLHERRRVTE
eukprot:364751-Prymnesium_polylepis.1